MSKRNAKKVGNLPTFFIGLLLIRLAINALNNPLSAQALTINVNTNLADFVATLARVAMPVIQTSQYAQHPH